MNLCWKRILGLIAFLQAPVFASEGSGRNAAVYESSILNLSATKAIPDMEAPWNIQNIDVSGFMGVVIAHNQILAPASLVSRAVFIQGQMMDEVNKVPLKVVFVDYEANLAVLSPLDGDLKGMKPIPLGEDLGLNAESSLIALENDRQLSRVNVRVLEMAMREVVAGGQLLLSYILTTQNRSSCKGEPLLRNNKLVGICMGFSDNQPWAYTASTLKHFLNDSLTEEKYRGFPVLGLNLGVAKSPYQKQALKWPDDVKGVRVVEVYENSAFADDIKQNDVITGMDRFTLDNRGFVKHPLWDSVPLRFYVSQKYSGDSVTLKVLRNGEPMQFTRSVRRYNGLDNRIPGLTFDGELSHLIIGGLVFREVGVDYLTSFGRDWMRSAPSELLHMFYFKNKPMLNRTRTIVMSHVLPDTFNQGYDKETILVLEKVNGKSVSNIDELRLTSRARAEDKVGEKFMVFDFQRGVRIVLPVKGLREAHLRIAKSYAITQQKSFLDPE